MAVTVSIESGIALKPERLPLVVALQYRGSYSQRGKRPWPYLGGRSHDDSERLRILSGAVWSLERPHVMDRAFARTAGKGSLAYAPKQQVSISGEVVMGAILRRINAVDILSHGHSTAYDVGSTATAIR